MYNGISGVILAGGNSKRFGGIAKSNIVINGKTIISGITDTLRSIFSELIIVTNSPGEFDDYRNFKIIGDIYTGVGPLAGIHAALKAASGEAVFVVAGDMPFLNSDLIVKQVEYYKNCKAAILIPQLNKDIEPLHAIYNISVTEVLEKFLNGDQNKAVRDFFKLVSVDYMVVEDSKEMRKAFTNINSPSDIVFY